MRFLIVGFFSLILVSCTDGINGFKEPDDLIPRDTMVMVLKDLTLIEAHVLNKYNNIEHYRETMILSGNEVLKRYNISQNRLDRSMDYYGSRQDVLSGIYSEILDSLNRDAILFSPERSVIKDSMQEMGKDVRKLPFVGKPGK